MIVDEDYQLDWLWIMFNQLKNQMIGRKVEVELNSNKKLNYIFREYFNFQLVPDMIWYWKYNQTPCHLDPTAEEKEILQYMNELSLF